MCAPSIFSRLFSNHLCPPPLTNLWFVQSIVNLPLFFPHGCIVEVLLVSVLGQRSELEAQLVDRQVVLPCVVLEGACEEALWEEEARDPEGLWVAVFNPVLYRKYFHRHCQYLAQELCVYVRTSMKCMRKVRSFTHELRGLRDGYAALSHILGTCGKSQNSVV